MDDTLHQVYGKSAKGRAELESRSRVLTGQLRTALILVDGRSSVKLLAAKLGPDAPAIIGALLRTGHVERVEPVAAAPAPRPARPKEAPPSRETSPPEDLSAHRRNALVLLAPHFGPDVAIVCQPLLDAETREAFELALDTIERKLAIYMGRAQAARTLAPLRD